MTDNPKTSATSREPKYYLYKFHVDDRMGYSGSGILFSTLADARKAYEDYIKEKRKDEHRVKPGDEHGKNFVRQKGDDFRPSVIEKCSFLYWYKCSYEYDEWDVGGEDIILSKVPVY